MERSDTVITGVGVIIEHDGRILAIQEASDDPQSYKEKGSISFPMERPFIDEKLHEAAIRGVKEETGLDIELLHIIGFYQFKGGFGVAYQGRVTGGNLSHRPSDEITNVQWIAPEELINLPSIRPGVKEAVMDFISGKNLPLESITYCF